MCNSNTQDKCKTTILKSSLCNYSNLSILVNGTITVAGQGADATAIVGDKNSKQVIIENCALFIDCIRGINITQGDVKVSNVIMPMYNSVEYGNNY